MSSALHWTEGSLQSYFFHSETGSHMSIVHSLSPVHTPYVSGNDRLPARMLFAIATAALCFGMAAAPALAAAPGDLSVSGFAPSRILVEPRAGLSSAAFAKILQPHGGKARKIGQSNLYIVDLPANASAQAVVAKLASDPHLKFAELDHRRKATFVPNDPYYGSQWHLAKVGADAAWNSTQGAGVTIAILDSGVDPTHPDLSPSLVPGYNFSDNNTNTADVCGHGTAVAGTAAAISNNGVGVAGVAGQAKIMPVRIAFNDPTYGCSAYDSAIANGLTYAADHGARIANISYGGVAGSSTILSASQYMKSKGGLVFVSAGNSGINENITPTTYMIPVSATDSNDVVTSWSSYGSFVALAAPGAGIWTTANGGAYQAISGTSFSSPLAAGVGALMMAANPGLDNLTVEKLMYSTAVDLGTAGRDIYYGYGRVNASGGVAAAVSATSTIDATPPTASILAPLAGATVSGLVAVNVTASDNVGVAHVDLQVNGSTVATDTASPFSFSWDSTGVANGMANLVAIAYDAAGNHAGSTTVSVNVANVTAPVVADTTPPTVVIVNPVAGKVSGTVSVSVNASDNNGAAGITQSLYIDGVLKAKGTGGTLGYSWNTRKVAAGTHTLQAIATDAAGNKSSASVQATK